MTTLTAADQWISDDGENFNDKESSDINPVYGPALA